MAKMEEKMNEAMKLVLFVWLWIGHGAWLSNSTADLLDGGRDNQITSSFDSAAGFLSSAIQVGHQD